MRMIKFRGISIETDRMVYGDLLQYRVYPVIFDKNKVQHEVKSNTVGQFTGLLDKNGLKIYEGDVIRVNHPEDRSGDFTNSIQKVFFDDGAFLHGNGERPPKRMFEHCEIIGNVWENPDLMEAK